MIGLYAIIHDYGTIIRDYFSDYFPDYFSDYVGLNAIILSIISEIPIISGCRHPENGNVQIAYLCAYVYVYILHTYHIKWCISCTYVWHICTCRIADSDDIVWLSVSPADTVPPGYTAHSASQFHSYQLDNLPWTLIRSGRSASKLRKRMETGQLCHHQPLGSLLGDSQSMIRQFIRDPPHLGHFAPGSNHRKSA